MSQLTKVFQNVSREDLYFLAKLSDQAERQEEMCDIVELMVHQNPVLTAEERNLVSVAFKNAVGTRRASWRVVTGTLDKQSADVTQNTEVIKAMKSQIESELLVICARCLKLLQTKILPQCQSVEDQVYYEKMVADYHRYVAESSDGAQKTQAITDAGDAYERAAKLAQELPQTNPIRLGLYLNYSVFFYEILNKRTEACKLAKEAFDAAIGELDSVAEEGYKDSTLIMQLIRDNLTLWNNETVDKDAF